jgi:hypothetical protein
MQIPILAGFIVLGLLFVAGAGIAYFIIYRNHINKRLNSDEEFGGVQRKQMMSPLKFVIILLAVIFGIFTVMTVVSAILFSFVKSSGETVVDDGEIPDLSAYSADEIEDSIFANFSPDSDISGYDRYVKTDGNFTFVYFLQTDDWGGEDLFPELMVYAYYSGSAEDFTTGYKMSADNDSSGFEASDWVIDENGQWFACNLNSGSNTFTLNYFIFSKESAFNVLSDADDEDEYAKYADDTGTLTITADEMPLYN